jgi:hypothetical protein
MNTMSGLGAEKYINNTVHSITGNLDQHTEWLNNETIANLLTVGIVIYAALFVGKLCVNETLIFKNHLVKILAMLAVAYIAKRNVSLAFVCTIAIIAIMMTNLKNTNEFYEPTSKHMDADDHIYEAMLGKCFCSCDGTKCVCRCAEGGEPMEISMDEIMAEEKKVPKKTMKKQMRFTESHHDEIEYPHKFEQNLPQDIYQSQPTQQSNYVENMNSAHTNMQNLQNMTDVVDEKDLIAQFNQTALSKVQKQFLSHEIQKNKGSLTTYTPMDNCGKSPYSRGNATPFGRPEIINQIYASTTMDGDYAPIKFT